MLRYALTRVGSAIVTLWLASIAVFLLLHAIPGDPASLLAGPDATRATVDALRQQLGLNLPLPVQYLKWLSGLLTGHLGYSYILGMPIATAIESGVDNTIELAAFSFLLALVIGFPLGIAGGLARGRVVQSILYGITTVFLSLPQYAVGLLLVLIFAVEVPVLPATGSESMFKDPELGIQYLLLPGLMLSLHFSAVIARFLQDSLAHAMREEHVQSAFLRGLPQVRVVLRHALPGSLPPVITIIGIHTAHIIGGAVIAENIFARHGLGQVLVSSLQSRDYQVVQDLILLLITAFIVMQVLTDVIVGMIDPRVTLQEG